MADLKIPAVKRCNSGFQEKYLLNVNVKVFSKKSSISTSNIAENRLGHGSVHYRDSESWPHLSTHSSPQGYLEIVISKNSKQQ